jgi:hypothetical protein
MRYTRPVWKPFLDQRWREDLIVWSQISHENRNDLDFNKKRLKQLFRRVNEGQNQIG